MTKTKIEFLYLDEEDMIKAGVLDMPKCVETIDEMFRVMGSGDYLMGGIHENDHGLMLFFPPVPRSPQMPKQGPDRRFMAMPAYLGGRFYACGNKWYGSNRANLEKGLPRSILMMMLNDVDTGAPLALMSANLMSSTRTGAVPGVATKYLQKSDASIVGIVGAGYISHSCAEAILCTIKNKGEVRVYDIIPEKSAAFCEEMQVKTGVKFVPVETLEEAVKGCDIVSIAASGAHPVEVKDEWITPGTVLELTGAASLSAAAYRKSRVVFDNWIMHQEFVYQMRYMPELLPGTTHITAPELCQAVIDGVVDEASILSLSDIVANPDLGRKSDDEVFIFVTGGMPTEDVAWGKTCYDRAVELGIGQTLKLWDEPYRK